MKVFGWLAKIGFIDINEFRKPVVGEWYINKNTNVLCFVYNEDSIPCDCVKCGGGKRRIVKPVTDYS